MSNDLIEYKEDETDIKKIVVDLKKISNLEKEYLLEINSKHKKLLQELAEGKVNDKSLEKLGELAKK